MPTLNLRVDLDTGARIGRGKITLLEHVAEAGSISAAARAIGMSYRRAWDLVDDLNRCFGRPVVRAKAGGRQGGGAELTPLGRGLVAHYRAIEAKAEEAARSHLQALEAAAGGSDGD
jgi:molybdate transport system regulatory protein